MSKDQYSDMKPMALGDNTYTGNPPPYPTQGGYPQQGYPQQAGYQPVASGQPGIGYNTSQNTVIVSQPGTVVVAPQEVPPPIGGTVCLSCFVIICCFCPLGCAAFIFALLASSATNYAEAQEKLALSKKLSIAGIVTGIIIIILSIILQMLGIFKTQQDVYNYNNIN